MLKTVIIYLFWSLIAVVFVTATSTYRIDREHVEIILQLHDINMAVNNEARINVPDIYAGYNVTELWAWNTTAGSTASPTDTFTMIQINDITGAAVIDTIRIRKTEKAGSKTGLSYQVTSGMEIGIKTINVLSTPAQGCRVGILLEDIDGVRG